ncbi:ribokinase [Hungatella effluvii]|uniref:Ribokinase n=1 Tax=Hungatella effluvii TaxID=1096246 RepID=A0A2V3XXJ2_9FIRM|nr:ribokinase [Hungatella effluvii]PXX48566.1 ribokinase [Hungatella effluvii]
MSKGILVVGSLNMDMSISLNSIPAVGETVLGNDLFYRTGGKGANQACAAGRLGGDVRMLGCLGWDEFGDKQIESLKWAGVDTSCLKKSENQPTGTAVIYVDSNGDNNIAVVPGANKDCDLEYLKAQDKLFGWCGLVVLQMEIPYESVLYAAQRAKEEKKTVILNPAPAPNELPDELYRLVDYLTPNETELMKLSGITDCDMSSMKRGAELLLDKGVGCVIVTLGDKGALLVKKGEEYLYPARKVKPVDTTAAGDCFNGAFAVALAEGKTEGEALEFANTASSIAVTRKGAQDSLPTREELDSCIKKGLAV